MNLTNIIFLSKNIRKWLEIWLDKTIIAVGNLEN